MHKQLDLLKQECLKCTKCDLSKTRTNVVFGSGTEECDILFIGEAPGETEDLSGEAFVGRGGKLLTTLLEQNGFYREKNIYIVNSVKCRPENNRNPKASEQKACRKWLISQIEIINPKIIICIGRISAMELIKKDFKIMKEHGEFFKIDNRLYMAILHPVAVLRNINNKPLVEQDLAKLKLKVTQMGLKF